MKGQWQQSLSTPSRRFSIKSSTDIYDETNATNYYIYVQHQQKTEDPPQVVKKYHLRWR